MIVPKIILAWVCPQCGNPWGMPGNGSFQCSKCGWRSVSNAIAEERKRIIALVEKGDWLHYGEDYYQTFDQEKSIEALVKEINGVIEGESQ